MPKSKAPQGSTLQCLKVSTFFFPRAGLVAQPCPHGHGCSGQGSVLGSSGAPLTWTVAVESLTYMPAMPSARGRLWGQVGQAPLLLPRDSPPWWARPDGPPETCLGPQLRTAVLGYISLKKKNASPIKRSLQSNANLSLPFSGFICSHVFRVKWRNDEKIFALTSPDSAVMLLHLNLKQLISSTEDTVNLVGILEVF